MDPIKTTMINVLFLGSDDCMEYNIVCVLLFTRYCGQFCLMLHLEYKTE